MFRYIIFIDIQYSALFSSRLCILGLFVKRCSGHSIPGMATWMTMKLPTPLNPPPSPIWSGKSTKFMRSFGKQPWSNGDVHDVHTFFNASWRAKVTTWMYHEIRMPMSGARQVESPTTEDVQSCRAAQCLESYDVQRLPCQTAGGDRPKATCLRFKHVWLQFWKRATDFWIHDSGKHLCITCPRMYD